jgi:hypothetical protein
LFHHPNSLLHPFIEMRSSPVMSRTQDRGITRRTYVLRNFSEHRTSIYFQAEIARGRCSDTMKLTTLHASPHCFVWIRDDASMLQSISCNFRMRLTMERLRPSSPH